MEHFPTQEGSTHVVVVVVTVNVVGGIVRRVDVGLGLCVVRVVVVVLVCVRLCDVFVVCVPEDKPIVVLSGNVLATTLVNVLAVAEVLVLGALLETVVVVLDTDVVVLDTVEVDADAVVLETVVVVLDTDVTKLETVVLDTDLVVLDTVLITDVVVLDFDVVVRETVVFDVVDIIVDDVSDAVVVEVVVVSVVVLIQALWRMYTSKFTFAVQDDGKLRSSDAPSLHFPLPALYAKLRHPLSAWHAFKQAWTSATFDIDRRRALRATLNLPTA